MLTFEQFHPTLQVAARKLADSFAATAEGGQVPYSTILNAVVDDLQDVAVILNGMQLDPIPGPDDNP